MKKSFLFLSIWMVVCSGTAAPNAGIQPAGAMAITVNATEGAITADYSTLKSAFDAINAGIHHGNITLLITASTVEDQSAVLFGSGTGEANYSSVKIFPAESGLSVTGNFSAPLIDLNGADHITIDGSPDGNGNVPDLVLSNTSDADLAFTSTVLFINGATNNVIKNCQIRGSGKSARDGIISFASSNATTGNDNNIITNNNITNADNAKRPVTAISSSGTYGLENSKNHITYNNIYDFLNRSRDAFGICLFGHSTKWTIKGNSFFETTEFIPGANVTYGAIEIYYSGGGYTISDNYIGGSAPLCKGRAWTKHAGFDNPFVGINVVTTIQDTSHVQNNTIRNFDWHDSANDIWAGIAFMDLGAGVVNMGTLRGNIIGGSAADESIKIDGTDEIYGYVIASNGTFNCHNNSINTLTISNASNKASNFYGFNIVNFKEGSISRNRIENISTTSPSTSGIQSLYAIYADADAEFSIDNNTISHLDNGSKNPDTNDNGVVNGITSTQGKLTIAGNEISNLTIGNANINLNDRTSVCGIVLSGTSSRNIIAGNKIYNLSNNNPLFEGCVMGLYFNGNTTISSVSGNYIHSLGTKGKGIINGIKIVSGVTAYTNNLISLDGNSASTVCGIYDTGDDLQHTSLFFNTIYISGNLEAGVTKKSYAFLSNAPYNNRDIRNNIFVNERSTVGGESLHYAAYFSYSTAENLAADYNNYYATGVGGRLIHFGGIDYDTIPVDISFDPHDVTVNPGFAQAGGKDANDYLPSDSRLKGISISSVTTDIHGNARNSVPTMGAFEFIPTPMVSSFSPSTAVTGMTVIITGTHLTGTSEVNFGGVPASAFQVISPDSISAIVASGSSGNISVTTPSGTASIPGFNYESTLTWIGALSSDWTDAGNWRPATVPFAENNIVIPQTANQPVISDFTISPTGSVTLSSGSELTVTGTLTNNGAIRILSDASGTGSLIAAHVAGSGTSAAQRFMIANAWHLVAPPLAGQDVANLLVANASIATATNGTARGMMDYDPANNRWNSFFENSATSRLSSGKGFSVRIVPGRETISFVGSIQTGEQIIPGLVPGKWNCIGNPYTSAIGINSGSSSSSDFLTVNGIVENNIDPLSGIYIWDTSDENNGKTGHYTAISNVPGAINEVQQGQAFFVKMSSSATQVKFDPAMQLHKTTLTLKSAAKLWSSIKLAATVNNQSSSTLIAFNRDMTRGPDPTYDAGLFAADQDLTIYTRLVDDNGSPFAIQALPEPETQTMIIPVGISSREGGELIISANTSNLGINTRVMLEDRVNQTFTDLSKGVYKISVIAGSVLSDRFLLHTSGMQTGNVYGNDSAGLKVIVIRNKELRLSGEVTDRAVVTMYDLIGRIVLEKNLRGGNLNVIDLPVIKNGIYLIRVKDRKMDQTFKLSIRE